MFSVQVLLVAKQINWIEPPVATPFEDDHLCLYIRKMFTYKSNVNDTNFDPNFFSINLYIIFLLINTIT